MVKGFFFCYAFPFKGSRLKMIFRQRRIRKSEMKGIIVKAYVGCLSSACLGEDSLKKEKEIGM